MPFALGGLLDFDIQFGNNYELYNIEDRNPIDEIELDTILTPYLHGILIMLEFSYLRRH